MNTLERTPPDRRHYGLVTFTGLIVGVVPASVKWGVEVPLPPCNPVDMFNAAYGPESLIRVAGQIDRSRNFLNSPHILLWDWLGLTDPSSVVYTFAGHVFDWVGVTHIIFSTVFVVGYCVVAEVLPKIKFWRDLLVGALTQLSVHIISFPLMGFTLPLFDLLRYGSVSEALGHLVWFWSIEIICRDLRNRITYEPDLEIPLGSNR